MKTGAGIAAATLALTLAAGGGYWFGQRPQAGHAEGEAAQGTPAADKPLYYRNPMGLPDTSPVPKKDPMGMDYIPVYAGEAEEPSTAAGAIRISTEKIQKLGVRTESAELRSLDRSLRVAGRVEIDERRSFTISPKFEGYVERLHVNVTGQPVAKGQPLFEAYSPELVSAQREYIIAAQGVEALKDAGSEAQAGMRQLAESSLSRLRNWDIPEDEIRALAKSGASRRTLGFRSPVTGIVIEKKAVQGMRFMPGEALYQVADLSSVWVLADVFEQDIGQIRVGAPARVRIDAYPDKVFEGRVSYVYPTLNAENRTVPVRVDLPNPGQLLKPSMFAQLELPVGSGRQVLTVSDSALIDSGTRQIVLIARGEGRFEPREVRPGARGARHVEILDGLKAGEQVVVSANFLLDAESNLKAVLSGFGAGQGSPGQNPATSKVAGHKAEGTVDGVDAGEGTVTLSHGPVASLNWPAMTMDFKVANPSLLKTLKPGSKVGVEFVERQPGEWVITAVTPAGSHTGH
ncbi:efflux RND transporter periplasmic adaptor subunit [Zoogloea dura]|uniref:Efflux RND transporter periplasmic adaptor subunit n=1 Tax=Zoogloea dura TaxID=2728840 RepID=A0A848FZZ1_9RHOO|nr:efflux RND transporter periplasmic adaptor subunit [Zoogloea dura]NML24375.1 efflux RND transporter periplasmic adaptor subunit [Zoogloea dura]